MFSLLLMMIVLACSTTQPDTASTPSEYLFVWGGPHGAEGHEAGVRGAPGASNFLAVIDADPASATYGEVLASTDVGTPGAMAHHTELSLPIGHSLFANDYLTGQIFLFDLTDPLAPRLTARIDTVPGFRYPHNFARLPNGNVLATLQYGNGALAGDPGGLAEFDRAGRLLRTSSAADPAFAGAHIRPNAIEMLPALDRAVTTSMPMFDEPTADVIQIWRVSDLRLLHTIPLPVPADDSSYRYPYDVRVLDDGRTAMLNTYYCEFYRLRDLDSERPRMELVHSLQGPHSEGCAVPVLLGDYWVVPVAAGHAIVNLDVSDPARPREVSTLQTESTFLPHWIAADPCSDRIVVMGADEGEARALIAHVDPSSGRLSWDERFRDAGSARRGVSFDRQEWPHGNAAHAIAHAALFGRARR